MDIPLGLVVRYTLGCKESGEDFVAKLASFADMIVPILSYLNERLWYLNQAVTDFCGIPRHVVVSRPNSVVPLSISRGYPVQQ